MTLEEVVEMVVAFEAIKFASKAGFRDVIIEGDNIFVINAICSNEESLASCGATVANIVRMSRSYNRVNIFFC